MEETEKKITRQCDRGCVRNINEGSGGLPGGDDAGLNLKLETGVCQIKKKKRFVGKENCICKGTKVRKHVLSKDPIAASCG